MTGVQFHFDKKLKRESGQFDLHKRESESGQSDLHKSESESGHLRQ